MVPCEGDISNRHYGDFLAEEKENNKHFCTEFKQAVSEQDYDELFEILAQWNDYLENHVEGFKELGL